jgi:hypothetical protein
VSNIHTTLEVSASAAGLKNLEGVLEQLSQKAAGLRQAVSDVGGDLTARARELADVERDSRRAARGEILAERAAERAAVAGERAEQKITAGRSRFGKRALAAAGGYTMTGGRAASGAFAAGYEELAAAASGMASGDFGAAAAGAVSASYGRERAEREALWGGTVGGAGGALTAMGGAAMLLGPGGAAVGIGMMIGGALLSIGSDLGARIGNAQAAVLEARESAAVQKLTSAISARGRLAQSFATVSAFGGEAISDAEFAGAPATGLGLSERFGFAPQEIADRQARFVRGGGRQMARPEFLLAAERGYGLDAGQVAGFMRPLRRGGSAHVPDPNGFTAPYGYTTQESFMQRVIQNATTGSGDISRLPEYLAGVSGLHEQFVPQGLRVHAGGLEAERVGMMNQGFMPRQAVAIQQNQQSFGGSLLERMTNQRMPREVTEQIMMAGLFRQFGGYDEALGGLEGLIESGGIGQFARDQFAGLPPELQRIAQSHLSGLFPEKAGLLQRVTPAEYTDAAGAGKGTGLFDAAEAAMAGAPGFDATRFEAQRQAMELAFVSVGNMSEQLARAMKIAVDALESAGLVLPQAIERIDKAHADFKTGVRGGPGVVASFAPIRGIGMGPR